MKERNGMDIRPASALHLDPAMTPYALELHGEPPLNRRRRESAPTTYWRSNIREPNYTLDKMNLA